MTPTARAGLSAPDQEPGHQAEVVGVDGCKGGWVAIVLQGGRFSRAVLAAQFRDLLRAVPTATVVAVDIPIGLANARSADAAARQVVGARSSSVFPTSPRAVVEAATYEEANRHSRALIGKGISKQTFALAKKILEVEDCRDDPGATLYEVHPEVSFWALAGGVPLQASKRSWTGQAERRALLEAVGIVLPTALGPSGSAAADDLLDAAVAAWSAQRIASGHGRSLLDPPERDADGRSIAIWY